MQPVSRAYEKLKFALEHFKLDLTGKTVADFGSSTGGFVQALLETKCVKLYSVETSKNRLHFVLKDDKRVNVLDNMNAVHIDLSEKVDFISIDVGWTKQNLILPNAVKNLAEDGLIVTLVKPHYEAGKNLNEASEGEIKEVLEKVREEIGKYVEIVGEVESPLRGKKAGNREFLWLMRKK